MEAKTKTNARMNIYAYVQRNKRPLATGHKSLKATVSIKLITADDMHGPCVPEFMTGKIIRRAPCAHYKNTLVRVASKLWGEHGQNYHWGQNPPHYLFTTYLVNNVTGDVLTAS